MANYSTYARAVLSNSASISKLIRKYSHSPSGKQQTELSPFSLLSMTEIEQALFNPQNSIKDKIILFADVVRIHREIIALQQEGYKQQLLIESSIKAIREKFAKADKIKRELLAEAVNRLENEYKKITKVQEQLEKQEAELTKLEQKLNQMTIEHDKEWDDYREKYLQLLAEELQSKSIPLTELEKNEILNRDIWVEVIKRFQIQEMEIADYIDIARPDYLTYFELKTYLAIHASLSRRMLPSSAEDIYNA